MYPPLLSCSLWLHSSRPLMREALLSSKQLHRSAEAAPRTLLLSLVEGEAVCNVEHAFIHASYTSRWPFGHAGDSNIAGQMNHPAYQSALNYLHPSRECFRWLHCRQLLRQQQMLPTCPGGDMTPHRFCFRLSHRQLHRMYDVTAADSAGDWSWDGMPPVQVCAQNYAQRCRPSRGPCPLLWAQFRLADLQPLPSSALPDSMHMLARPLPSSKAA